jgi:hypothetical protein
MEEEDVNVVSAELLEAGLERRAQTFHGEISECRPMRTPATREIANSRNLEVHDGARNGHRHAFEPARILGTDTELGGNDGAVALASQELAEYGFGIAVTVTSCGVKERDARVPGGVHSAQGGAAADAAEHRTAAEAQYRGFYLAASTLSHGLYFIVRSVFDDHGLPKDQTSRDC